MPPSADESDVPGVVGRRSARLSIIVPVTLRGTDASGQAFKENTWTISVNKHGGRIATFHQLAAEDQIVIENPLLGRTAKARVNRICEKRFAEDPYEVCVELLEAQNIWGVKLPPEDWQGDQVVPGQQKSESPQAARPSPSTPAAPAEKGGVAEATPAAPSPPPAEVKEATGGLSQFNMAVNALSRLAGEGGPSPAQPASHRQEAMGVLKAPVVRPQAADALALKALQEKISEAQSLRQELTALTERVQATRVEVENLLSKSHQALRDGTIEAEQVAKKVEEAGDKQLQSVRVKLDQEIERCLGPAFERLAGETQQRLQAEAAAIIESVAKDMRDRLSPLVQADFSEVALAQSKHAAEEAKTQVDELVKDATGVAEARLRKIMEELSPSLSAQIERSAEQATREQMEQFKAQMERIRKSSEDSSQQNLERMRQEIQAEILNAATQARNTYKEESGTAAKAIAACVDSAVDSLNRAGDEAVSKLQEARQNLELSSKKAMDECLPRLADESASALEKFRAETQALTALLQSEVKSTAQGFLEKTSGDISGRLQGAMEGALEVVARDFNKQAEDAVDLLKEGLRSTQQQCVEETRRQLAAARESTLASLESEAGANLASFRERLHATLLEMQAQQTQDMEKQIQTSLQGQLESLSHQIRSAADESAAQVMADVRSRAEQALQELPSRLYKGVGMAALVAREWEEQAKTRLEAQLGPLLEDFQKQLQGMVAGAEERQRHGTEALQGLFQSRLRQAARLFEGLETEAGPSKEGAHEEPTSSSDQPTPAAAAPVRPAAAPPLLEKQQKIIEEALGEFRSGLSRILSDRTPKE